MRSYLVRILALAHTELRGVLRSHPFRLFLPVAALVVLVAPSLVLFAFRERAAMSAQLGVSTAGLFATVLGLVAGSASLARDRESGTLPVLLSRPIREGGYLAGKWLGIASAVTISLLVLGGLHVVVVEARGGAPRGTPPLGAALLVANFLGWLSAAVGLAFSTRLRAGAAFAAGAAFLLLGHVTELLPASPAFDALRLALPRTAWLHLAGEAAFGPFPPSLWLFAILHAILYTLFLLALAAPIARRS